MKQRTAFTLVELVVVVLILGILAGVAAPKLLNTSGSATDASIRQTLAVIRNAIELYAANNGGALPPCTGTGADFHTAMEPYIRGDFPNSPLVNGNNITPTTTTTANGANAWMFNTTTGEFICNSTATDNSTPPVAYSSY